METVHSSEIYIFISFKAGFINCVLQISFEQAVTLCTVKRPADTEVLT